MKKVLIGAQGYIGDNLFASGIAKKLKEDGVEEVHFVCSIDTPFELINNNPYIDKVILNGKYLPEDVEYDKEIWLTPVHQGTEPPLQFQKEAGVSNPDTKYKIYTNKLIDEWYNLRLEPVTANYVTIAIQRNWEERTFLYTPEEYEAGVNQAPLGYGGKRRRVADIIKKIEDKRMMINVIYVGRRDSSNDYRIFNPMDIPEYTMTASILKKCDYFIGTEGGLCNLAAGVGTKTIITGDFVHQLYGPNGVLKKIDEPKLGPEFYFPDAGHISLDPFLSDDEVADEMIKIFQKEIEERGLTGENNN